MKVMKLGKRREGKGGSREGGKRKVRRRNGKGKGKMLMMVERRKIKTEVSSEKGERSEIWDNHKTAKFLFWDQ